MSQTKLSLHDWRLMGYAITRAHSNEKRRVKSAARDERIVRYEKLLEYIEEEIKDGRKEVENS